MMMFDKFQWLLLAIACGTALLILLWFAVEASEPDGISVKITTTICLDNGLCRTPDFEAGVYCWHWKGKHEALSCLPAKDTNFVMTEKQLREIVESVEGLEIWPRQLNTGAE